MNDARDTQASAARSEVRAQPPQGLRRFLLIIGVLAVILAVWGIVSRVRARNELARQTVTASVPVVNTHKPSRSPAIEELVLPGDVQAFIEAPIYARTSGYLKKWYVDIGAPVKKGQLLAEIDTPEVDQELRQSQSQLATAQANARLAESTNERWKGLLATRSVSQQDADTKAADAAASRATAASAQANVARLEELESFKRVVAPFDGVVTLRNTDIGALINAGQSAGAALFRVADTQRLRVYVQVPEPYATRTQPGVQADLRFTEHPGHDYPATLVRTARALDPVLRTLQVEFQVDNPAGELFPGSYAEVHIKVPGSAGTLRVPASALLFRAAGLQIAVVGANGRVSLRHIVEGRDFGRSVEVLSGLSAEDEIIDNPPDSLVDGTQVRIARPGATVAGPRAAAGPS